MMTRGFRRIAIVAATAAGFVALLTASPLAQRGGGGGASMGPAPTTRAAALVTTLKLDNDQKKQIKTILDAAYKDAAPIRDALTKTRAAAGAAIQAGKDKADAEKILADYAVQVTAMASAEAKATARMKGLLSPDQQGDAAAWQSVIYIMRGAFIGKKWDTVPDTRFY